MHEPGEVFKKRRHIIFYPNPLKAHPKEIKTSDQDAININALKTSEKERAENIMIVDLVRNDLSKICKKGSVVVDELCAIYSFPRCTR